MSDVAEKPILLTAQLTEDGDLALRPSHRLPSDSGAREEGDVDVNMEDSGVSVGPGVCWEDCEEAWLGVHRRAQAREGDSALMGRWRGLAKTW